MLRGVLRCLMLGFLRPRMRRSAVPVLLCILTRRLDVLSSCKVHIWLLRVSKAKAKKYLALGGTKCRGTLLAPIRVFGLLSGYLCVMVGKSLLT